MATKYKVGKRVISSNPVTRPMKAYILVKDWVDVGHAVNSCCHAGTLISEHWTKDDPAMKEWWEGPIRKVTCKVTEKQFEEAKNFEDWFVVTEEAFDKQEVVLVLKPRKDWPKFFNFLALYK
jgi:hypothetical protein